MRYAWAIASGLPLVPIFRVLTVGSAAAALTALLCKAWHVHCNLTCCVRCKFLWPFRLHKVKAVNRSTFSTSLQHGLNGNRLIRPLSKVHRNSMKALTKTLLRQYHTSGTPTCLLLERLGLPQN